MEAQFQFCHNLSRAIGLVISSECKHFLDLFCTDILHGYGDVRPLGSFRIRSAVFRNTKSVVDLFTILKTILSLRSLTASDVFQRRLNVFCNAEIRGK